MLRITANEFENNFDYYLKNHEKKTSISLGMVYALVC